MQLRSLTIAVIVMIMTVMSLTSPTSAAICSVAQQAEIERLEEISAAASVCQSSASFNVDVFDPQAWAHASPCRNATCVAFLTVQAARVPDCDVESVNSKSRFANRLAFCIDVASGKLSAEELKSRWTKLTQNDS